MVTKERYGKHRDELLAYAKKYRAKHKGQIRIQRRRYYLKDKEKILFRNRGYFVRHKTEIAEYHRRYVKKHKKEITDYKRAWWDANKRFQNPLQREYYLLNKERIKQTSYKNRKKYLKNPLFRIQDAMSRQIYFSLKRKKAGRHWETLVGYSLEDLKQHLESQFTSDMRWDNYGLKGYWTIDHKIPRSWFHFKSSHDKEFKRCWALSNLQPLQNHINFSKGNRYAHS